MAHGKMHSFFIGIAIGSGVGILAWVLLIVNPKYIIPVGLGVFAMAITFLMHYWKQAQQESNKRYYRSIRRQLNRMERRIKEVQGLSQLGVYNDPYPLPFGGGWALTGVCQDSCHFFHAANALFPGSSCESSSRAGLSQTTSFLDQSRVMPDQRSGCLALACS